MEGATRAQQREESMQVQAHASSDSDYQAQTDYDSAFCNQIAGTIQQLKALAQPLSPRDAFIRANLEAGSSNEASGVVAMGQASLHALDAQRDSQQRGFEMQLKVLDLQIAAKQAGCPY